MNEALLNQVIYPLLVTFGSVLVVALGNLIVKSLGRSGRLPARVDSIEKALAPLMTLPEEIKALDGRQASTEALNRLTLKVISNLTSAMKASLEAQKGYVNGNVDTAIVRLTQVELDTQEYLIDAAIPQEAKS